MNEISKSSGSTSNIQGEIIALLDEEMIVVDASYADFITQTSADLKLFDEEIRKLWDLSNKRNRKDIDTLRGSVDKLIANNNKFSDEFNLVSNNFSSIRSDLISIQEELNELVLVSSGVNSLNSKLNELTTRLSFAEENLRSFENYRKSLNQTLIEIQASINSADKTFSDEVARDSLDNL